MEVFFSGISDKTWEIKPIQISSEQEISGKSKGILAELEKIRWGKKRRN